jgi:hypothetical protein
MVFVDVAFHTDGISSRKGHVVPKRAWTNGAVYVRANKAHGIRAQSPQRFNSLLELPHAIGRVLKANGITLVAYRTKGMDVEP